MTIYAKWSTIYAATGSPPTFTDDRLTAYYNGGHAGVAVATALTSGGPFIWGVTIGSQAMTGVINGAELPANTDPTHGVIIRDYGLIQTFNSGGTDLGTMPSWVQWQECYIVFDPVGKKIWFSQDKVAFWGWNGSALTSYTLSQVLAGTGGISTSHVTTPYPWVQGYNNGSTNALVLDSNVTPLPSGLTNLPATLQFTGSPSEVNGSPTQIPWASGRNETTAILQSPDGGTFVSAGGTATGTSGTATGATYTNPGLQTVALQSVTEPLDQTLPVTFGAHPALSGTGTLLSSGIYVGINDSSGPTLALSNSSFNAIYSYLYEKQGGTTAPGGIGLYNSAGAGSHVEFDNGACIQFNFYVAPNTGSTTSSGSFGNNVLETAQGTIQTSIVGTVLVGSANATLMCAGGTPAYPVWNDGTAFSTPAEGIPFTELRVGAGATFGQTTIAWIVYSAASETLTINGSSIIYAGSSLAWTGTCENATLSSGAWSVDGSGFSGIDTLTVSGTNYSAVTSVGSLSNGAHTLQMEDASTSVTSATSTFYVGAGTLAISASYASGTTTVTGTDVNEALTAINLSIDGDPFSAPGSLSITGTAFTATDIGTLAIGPHYAQAKNAVTGTTSNIAPFSVTGPVESILLNYASCVAGGTLSIAGTTTNGPAAALNISTTAGVTFGPAATYASATGSVAAFSATNGTLAAGSYTIYAQDAVTGVISNPLPLTVSAPGTVTGISPYNLAAPAFSAIYTTSQIIPLRQTASQQVSATLSGQAITLNVYQRGGSVYMDVYVNGASVLVGQLCLNQVFIIRSAYLGVVGDFAFWDSQATASGVAMDPIYTGLGSRFLLVYYS